MNHHTAPELPIPSPVADGGGAERSEAEGVPRNSGRPAYHKLLAAKPLAKPRAKELRAEMTPPERRLWNHLRGHKLADLRFRRQHPLGPYIADFYCHEAAVVVEIDGASHQGARRDHDDVRDRWMMDRGLFVMRVCAIDVRDNLESALGLIERTAMDRIRSRTEKGGTPSDPPSAGHLPRR